MTSSVRRGQILWFIILILPILVMNDQTLEIHPLLAKEAGPRTKTISSKEHSSGPSKITHLLDACASQYIGIFHAALRRA
jgi:hypothetical protein